MYKEKKESADRMWMRIFNEALKGSVDIEKLYIAMQMCNISEQALLNEEYKLS